MKHLSILMLMSSLCFPRLVNAEPREEQSLDGTWQIVFDSENVGRTAQWFRTTHFPVGQKRDIAVPGCWELTEKDYEGVAFYRHTFRVPERWEGMVVRLQFDAVNFLAEVWLNDVAIGVHEGGFTPFEFRVDPLFKAGQENTLILRVAGPILLQDKVVDGVGPMETPQWRGAIAGGIWQSVRLIATKDVYVEDVFIEPKIADDTTTFHLRLRHVGKRNVSAQVAIAVRAVNEPGTIVTKTVRNIELKPGLCKESWTLNIPDAVYWSPDHPHLYRADVTLKYDDHLSDHWNARFGLREFTIRDKQWYLNGKPFFLKATFFEGLYPLKLAYPDSREMAIREIQLAKEAGFNMIRPWRKPPPPMWLDLAEEMGVLTVGSLAIECMDLPFESARLPMWVENEVRETILRDRNRTCVVQWELFNELKRPVLMQMLHPMTLLARELDPTRLILDESGGWAQGANMFLPYASEPTKFNDIHVYPGPQVTEEVYKKLILTGIKTHDELRAMGIRGRLPGRNVIPGLMTFISELGYGSLPDLVDNNQDFAKTGNPVAPPMVYHRRLADEHRQALRESGFDRIYPDLKQFCLDQQKIHGAANKRMIEVVRCNPLVSGYCIHALCAGDWIMGAGILDLFRNPKTYAYEGTKQANQPRILAMRVNPRNVYAARGATIDITGVNELAGFAGKLKVTIKSENQERVFSKIMDVQMQTGITPLFREELDTGGLSGTYTVAAEVMKTDGSRRIQNEYDFDVFSAEQLAVPDRRIAVLDLNDGLKPFLKQVGISYETFDKETDPALPVFVSRTWAEDKMESDIYNQLAAFIQSGGTGVYLGGGGQWAPWGKAGNASGLLPVSVRIKGSVGNWLGIPHMVNEHPIFDGLPVNCMMGSVYENVIAIRSLLDVEGVTVAGSIGFDFAPDFEVRKRHYYGPGDTWWGSDLSIAPVGRGRCILSQLRLVENLGKDPVADNILYNLIRFAAGR